MVRLHTLSIWLPKHKGFAGRYARESCCGRILSDVRGHIVYRQGVLQRDQFVEQCCCHGSFFYILAKQECMGENKQKACFHALPGGTRSQTHWCHIKHERICRKDRKLLHTYGVKRYNIDPHPSPTRLTICFST